jgi:hypothetical protein
VWHCGVVEPYNYEHFTAEHLASDEFEAFRVSAARVGEAAPDGVLVDAASGEEVVLSSLWRSQPVVLEFGSLT